MKVTPDSVRDADDGDWPAFGKFYCFKRNNLRRKKINKAEDMYIISALHEIPILTKRIEKQKEELTKYASSISNFTPEFGSAEAQRKEVERLLQSTLDLI